MRVCVKHGEKYEVMFVFFLTVSCAPRYMFDNDGFGKLLENSLGSMKIDEKNTKNTEQTTFLMK